MDKSVMITVLHRLALALILVGGSAAGSRADFDAGWRAYQAGDLEVAVAEWTDAAVAGDSRAQFNLGVLYDRGQGVPRDAAQALDWWRQAAGQGHGSARHNLALLLIEQGGKGNLAEAVDWLEKAAGQGFVRSLYSLGKLYETGLGVTADGARAFELIAAAAEGGFVKAQYGLGKMYRDGIGTAVDLASSVAWFRRAAEQGYAKAQSRLATRYERGEGVERDPVEALKWAIIAVDQGYEPAIEQQALLSTDLTTEQLSEAERRAKAFRIGSSD